MPSGQIRSLTRGVPRLLTVMLLGGMLTLSGQAAAQGTGPPPVQDPEVQETGQDSLQALVQEAQQLQQELVSLQRKAISESEHLQQLEGALQDSVQAAMVEADSTILQTMARMEEIPQRFEAAQQAGDQEQLTMIQAEAQQLQAHYLRLQDQIMQRETIDEQMKDFREELLEVMVTIDPEAREMYERMEELSRLLDQPG
ncbi:MAG: hypothetical protein R6W82_00640 [bacterium]